MKKKPKLSTPSDRVRFVLTTVFGDNQSAMSRAVGIAQPVISKVILGRQAPGKRFLQAVADLPKINPAWVFHGEGQPLLATQDIEEKHGWPVPVADGLLPGPPVDHQEMLTTRVEYVPRAIYRDTVYAVEARHCRPVVDDPAERMRAADLVFVDADAGRWQSNLQVLHDRLCAVSVPTESGFVIRMQRVPPDLQDSRRKARRFTDSDTDLAKRKVAKAEYGKNLRSIDVDGAPEQLDQNLVDVDVDQIVGIAVQLIRNF